MLLENFYSIREVIPESAEKLSVKVELNVNHPVYQGHFPEVPVAPGVCLIQMIKEVIMQHQKQNLKMTVGDNIKFMALVNPNQTPFFFIDYELRFPSPEMIEATAILRWEAVTYLKFKGKFKVVA